jgi:H+/Cl- antiporter ClcA
MTPRSPAARGLLIVSLAALVGLLCGGAASLFLTLLDWVTDTRVHHSELVFLLPVAGLLVGLVYQRWGAPVARGTGLVIDALADGGPPVPLRMAPMVLFGTLMTHLFGGSAGREGTAVQMGASLADGLAHRARLFEPGLRRSVIIAGVAGGFGAVFGTPIAGAVFALEFSKVGTLENRAFVPALLAALVGDLTTRALGVGHTAFPEVAPLTLSPHVLLKWAIFAVAIALVTVVFIALTGRMKRLFERHLPRLPMRMAVGGLVVIALWQLAQTDDYLGLGVPTIAASFHEDVPAFAFLAKLVFTAATLAFGFLGGEVTPLFFVGATLGNALAGPLELPMAMCAGVGLAAVFGAASNAPIALSIMAVELCGAAILPHVALVTGLAWLMTGRRSIYPAQRGLADKGLGA